MASWQNITSLTYPQIRELQDRKLRHFLRTQVYPFSSFYRRMFDEHKIKVQHIRSVSDLKHIPLISKADIVTQDDPQRYKEFILKPDQETIRAYWPKDKLLGLLLKTMVKGKEQVHKEMSKEYRPIFMTFTTGTTHSPVPVTYSRHDLDNLCVSGNRMVSLFDIKEDERIVNIFPFAPHLAFWQTFFGALEANVFALSTGGGKVMGTEGNLTAVRRSKPSVILGVPSYIYHMVRFAQEKKDDLSFLKKIVLGAGRVTPEYKLKLSSMLADCGAKQVSIFGTYGFTEARCAWAECPTENHLSSGYHLYPDKEIFQIIDPDTGEVRPDDSDGEIVYTPLDSRASVLLRYRTGDFVKGGIRHEACPYCGRRLRPLGNLRRYSSTPASIVMKVAPSLRSVVIICSSISMRWPRPITCGWKV